MIGFAVKVHQRGDAPVVLLPDGPVQGEGNGAAHAHLRQGQHTQDIGEQGGYPIVLNAQRMDKYPLEHQVHHQYHQLESKAGTGIDKYALAMGSLGHALFLAPVW